MCVCVCVAGGVSLAVCVRVTCVAVSRCAAVCRGVCPVCVLCRGVCVALSAVSRCVACRRVAMSRGVSRGEPVCRGLAVPEGRDVSRRCEPRCAARCAVGVARLCSFLVILWGCDLYYNSFSLSGSKGYPPPARPREARKQKLLRML